MQGVKTNPINRTRNLLTLCNARSACVITRILNLRQSHSPSKLELTGICSSGWSTTRARWQCLSPFRLVKQPANAFRATSGLFIIQAMSPQKARWKVRSKQPSVLHKRLERSWTGYFVRLITSNFIKWASTARTHWRLQSISPQHFLHLLKKWGPSPCLLSRSLTLLKQFMSYGILCNVFRKTWSDYAAWFEMVHDSNSEFLSPSSSARLVSTDLRQ